MQGDIGGERVLQKKWTTFLKAQLLCSLPDDGFPFNIIQDMFVLTPGPEDWKNTVFYGVFTSQWWGEISKHHIRITSSVHKKRNKKNSLQSLFKKIFKSVTFNTDMTQIFVEENLLSFVYSYLDTFFSDVS